MYDRRTWALSVIESRTLVPRDPNARRELLEALNVLRPDSAQSPHGEEVGALPE